jgi:hypothetical protein
MPTATARSLGKTGFVKEVLNDHPEANTRAVNAAWAAAGFEGTISHTLVTKVRSRLGLTGNIPKGRKKKVQSETAAEPTATGKRRGRPKGATSKVRRRRTKQSSAEANGTAAVVGSSGKLTASSGDQAMAIGRVRGGNQGKTAFVTEHLRLNPDATDEQINEAWASAGNDGGISGSLMYKIRAKKGLTGRRRTRGRDVGKKGRARSSSMGTRVGRTAEPGVGTPRPLDGRTSRGRSIAEVEADIDRLIFKLMGVGGMETIEDELRKVRRLLYRSYSV